MIWELLARGEFSPETEEIATELGRHIRERVLPPEVDGPAPPGGVQVDIVYEGAFVMSVLVAEGETAGSLALSLTGDQPLGDYELQAQLGEVTLMAVLHVVPGP